MRTLKPEALSLEFNQNIRACFYMCILYCCEGSKLDNSLGYYVTFVK